MAFCEYCESHRETSLTLDTSISDGQVGKLMTWLAVVTPDCKKHENPWQIIDIFSVCSDQCSGNAVRPSLGWRSFNQLLQTILSTNIFWSLSAKVGWPIYQLWMATQNVCKIGNQWHFWSQSSYTPLFGQFSLFVEPDLNNSYLDRSKCLCASHKVRVSVLFWAQWNMNGS